MDKYKTTSKPLHILSHIDCIPFFFLSDVTDAVLFREIILVNDWNLIIVIVNVFEKIANLCLEASVKGLHFFFFARIFIFTRHQPIIDKHFNIRYVCLD
jgi:hypothetical protein